MWLATLFHYPVVLIGQIVRDVLWFPVWWYTRGLYKCIRWVLAWCAGWWQALGVAIWLKYLLVPMYGQRDFFGRLVSFVMRLVQIVARTAFFVLLALVGLLLIVLWLVILPLIIWQIIYQMTALYGR